MSGRKFNGGEYRYGFNGKENDNEVKGDGNHLDFGGYGYDTRLGRRFNVDPIKKHHESPYAAFVNNPIWFVDPTGLDTIISKNNSGNLVIWLNYDDEKINYDKQMDQENWDFIEVNGTLEDAYNRLIDYTCENDVSLQNVVIRTQFFT